MAELVQLHIEKTVPELEQMERIGLFTREEIKKIIRQRRALEYTLRRRKKKKEDLLKYIQYEVNLLSLIDLRRKKLRCDFKKQEIDHVIATRINKLFKSVTLRFQDDVKLWISQIEFCKRMKWHHSISGLFTRMLQIHSSNPTLWIMAAKWEIEDNNAPENARHLLQRALRHHPQSKHLWLEYFRMELMYSDMVRKRREILGVQEIKTKDPDAENDAVLDGSVASVVYKNATAAIEDVEFMLSFLPICQDFDFTQKHIEDIFEDLQAKYPNSEETLDVLARRRLLLINDELEAGKEKGLKRRDVIANIENDIISKYEEAVKQVPTQKMWQFYIDYSFARLNNTKKAKKQNKIENEILKLFERASKDELLTSDQCIEWVKLLRSRGDYKMSLEVCLQIVHKWPHKVSLWHLCISLHIADKVDFKKILILFDEALSSLKDKDSLPIWQLGIQYLSLANPAKMISFFESGIKEHSRSTHNKNNLSIVSHLKVMYLEVVALQHGILPARDLYAKLTRSPPVSIELYKKMITIEKAQLKPSLDKLRKCYEEALRNFGSKDVDLWISYMQMEIEYGNPNIYNMLHWRAIKALDAEHIDQFVTKVTLFSTGQETLTNE